MYKYTLVMLAAYSVTGAHFVGRELSKNVVARMIALARPTIAKVLMMALLWLPIALGRICWLPEDVFSTPNGRRWYWKLNRDGVYSLILFAVLIAIGLWLNGVPNV